MNDSQEMQEELFDAARDSESARQAAPSSMPLPPGRGVFSVDVPDEEEPPRETGAEEPPAGASSRRGGENAPARRRPATAPAVSDAEFGTQVRDLRLRSGLSIEEVSAETLIKADYLRALEEGDFDALPALVYVTAYLRRLCRLYGAGPDESDALVLQLHDHLIYEIPEHPAIKVHDLETDEREQRRIRQIVFGVTATAVLLVLILAVAAVLLFAGTGRDGKIGVPFEEELLLRLQPRPELTLSLLPAREPGQ